MTHHAVGKLNDRKNRKMGASEAPISQWDHLREPKKHRLDQRVCGAVLHASKLAWKATATKGESKRLEKRWSQVIGTQQPNKHTKAVGMTNQAQSFLG